MRGGVIEFLSEKYRLWLEATRSVAQSVRPPLYLPVLLVFGLLFGVTTLVVVLTHPLRRVLHRSHWSTLARLEHDLQAVWQTEGSEAALVRLTTLREQTSMWIGRGLRGIGAVELEPYGRAKCYGAWQWLTGLELRWNRQAERWTGVLEVADHVLTALPPDGPPGPSSFNWIEARVEALLRLGRVDEALASIERFRDPPELAGRLDALRHD